MKSYHLCVIGGGNGGHQMAGHLTLAGHTINFFELPQFRKNIERTLKTGEIEVKGLYGEGIAKVELATTDIAEAITGVEYILIVVPAFGHAPIAELLSPHLKSGQSLILFPGNFGSLEMARLLRENGAPSDIVIAETSTLPYGCRLYGPGQVDCLLVATEFSVSAFPATFTSKIHRLLVDLYPAREFNGLRIKEPQLAANVIEVALSNPNPYIHPPATLLNTGRIEYSVNDFNLYREGITASVGQIIETTYKEFHAVGAALGLAPLSHPASAFKTSVSPMALVFQAPKGTNEIIASVKGPHSLNDRYVSEDIPYGLVPVGLLGDRFEVETPIIDAQVNLYSTIKQKNFWRVGRTLDDLGIANMSKVQLLSYLEGSAL